MVCFFKMAYNESLHATVALCMPYGIHSATVADISQLSKLKPKALKIQFVKRAFFGKIQWDWHPSPMNLKKPSFAVKNFMVPTHPMVCVLTDHPKKALTEPTISRRAPQV